jgi:hypothetical protein
VFRDFIYLDIDRVQSIIAQLEQGLLNEVMEGKTEQTSGRAMVNLLAMLLPVSASVEQGRGTSISESKVLHDYAFEAARRSLEEEGFLEEADDLDWDEIPQSGFVLVRGEAQIMDFETLRSFQSNFADLSRLFDQSTAPVKKKTQQEKQEERELNKIMKDLRVVIDTFYKDTMRVRITNTEDCGFIGPLAREHLREDIRNLIYKHGSNPSGEWAMLAEITRIPLRGESQKEIVGETEAAPEDSVSNMFDQMISSFNSLQEYLGSASYPDIAVSPVAVYREIHPNTET